MIPDESGRVLNMSELFDTFNLGEGSGSEQVRTLKRLAFMYHASGHYEKAEELLKIAQQWTELNRATQQDIDEARRDAA
jgi:hypothetical protein